jgi:hypothetical protein
MVDNAAIDGGAGYTYLDGKNEFSIVGGFTYNWERGGSARRAASAKFGLQSARIPARGPSAFRSDLRSPGHPKPGGGFALRTYRVARSSTETSLVSSSAKGKSSTS